MSDLTISGPGALSFDPLDFDEIPAGSVAQPTQPTPHTPSGPENQPGDALSTFADIMGISAQDLAAGPIDPEGHGIAGGGVFGNIMGDEPVEAIQNGHQQTIEMGGHQAQLGSSINRNLIKHGV